MKRIFAACCVFVMSFALMGDNRQAWADEFDDDSGLPATAWATIAGGTLLTANFVIGAVALGVNQSHLLKGSKPSRGWAITSYVTNGINATLGVGSLVVGMYGVAVGQGELAGAFGGILALASLPFVVVGVWGLVATRKAVRDGRRRVGAGGPAHTETM